MRRQQNVNVYIFANSCIRAKNRALNRHLFDATLNIAFFHLEFRYAVTKQSANAIGTLKNQHIVTNSSQLLRRGQARGPRANNNHSLACFLRRHLRRHPTFSPCSVNNFNFNLFDRHCIRVNAEHACRFARRRAQSPREFRKIICRMQALDRVSPISAIHKIIPVRDQVSERAPVIAERNSTVHAPPRLSG